METIENKVLGILKKYTPNPDVWANFTPEFGLIKDLKINSARIVDIILDMEEDFQVNITDEDIEQIKCVKDIFEVIKSKTA